MKLLLLAVTFAIVKGYLDRDPHCKLQTTGDELNRTCHLIIERCNLISKEFEPNVSHITNREFFCNDEYDIYGFSIRKSEINLPSSNNSLGNYDVPIYFVKIFQSNISDLSEGFFRNFPNASEVTMFYNKNLTVLKNNTFLGLKNLTRLMIHDNNITQLEPACFAGLDNLTELEISFNNFTDIPDFLFSSLEKLTILDLSYNHIDTIGNHSFKGLKKLRSLNLNSNNIRVLNATVFDPLSNLRVLDLSHNQIEAINGSFGLKKVRNLYLHGNALERVSNGTFRNMTNLVVLNLSSNKIHQVDGYVFKVLGNLRVLNLAKNEITTVSGKFELKDLQLLCLNRNNITSFSASEYNLENVTVVWASNPVNGVPSWKEMALPGPDEVNCRED